MRLLRCYNKLFSNFLPPRLGLSSFAFLLIVLLPQANVLVQAQLTSHPVDPAAYYGGGGGDKFSDSGTYPNFALKSLSVYEGTKNVSSKRVFGLVVVYQDPSGAEEKKYHGTTSGDGKLAFTYSPTEAGKITKMIIRSGSSVDKIYIQTTKGTEFSAGSDNGNSKTITFADGIEFKYFEGRKGTRIDALRLYVGPSPATPVPTPPPAPAPSLAPIDDAKICLDSTLTLLEEVKTFYPSKEKITVTSLNNKTTEIVDFDDASANAFYQEQCSKDSGGVYVEWTYESACTNSNTEDSVDVFVAHQPRCYSKLCNLEEHETAMFEEYALRLTEERNGGGWSCTGQLLKNGIESGCQFETEVLNGIDTIFTKNFDVKTEIKDLMFLFFFPKAEKEVTFPSLLDPTILDFKGACEDSGGIQKTAGYSEFLCGENAAYVVKNFPLCVGSSCTTGTDESYKDAITSQFQAKIVKVDERLMDIPDLKCILTASTAKPLLGTTIGFVFSVLVAVWHLA